MIVSFQWKFGMLWNELLQMLQLVFFNNLDALLTQKRNVIMNN